MFKKCYLFAVLGLLLIACTNENNTNTKQPEITHIAIRNVIIQDISFKNQYDSSWDKPDDGPDLFYKIFDVINPIYTSDVKNNIQLSDLPVLWSYSDNPILLSNLHSTYKFEFYDKDSTSEELMDVVYFNPDAYYICGNTYRLGITLNGSDSLKVTIDVQWE